MSNLEKLLEGVEVEWKTLGEVAEYEQPAKYIVESTAYRASYETPVLTAGKTFIIGYTNETNGIYKAKEKPVIIFDDFTTANKWVDFNFKVKSSAMKMITSKDETVVLIKYIYYWLNTITSEITESDHKRQWISNYSNKKIPIPPLSVQKEIVRILDKFSTLTAELQAELQARKSQYEYYRNQLLDYQMEESDQPSLRSSRSAASIQESDNQMQQQSAQNAHADISVLPPQGKVQWKTLGEVGEFVRGNGLPKADFTEVGVPAIHYGQIYTYYGTYTYKTLSFVSKETAKRLRKVNYGDVVITNTSENIEDVGKAVVYLGEEQAVTGGHATIFKPSIYILGKYFAYFTQTECFANQKRKYAKGTKVIDVSASDMSKIQIPIPPLQEQERIVAILDKFDTLTNSITEGLPKEIELRQKQYEYYRDMLLTFTSLRTEGEAIQKKHTAL